MRRKAMLGGTDDTPTDGNRRIDAAPLAATLAHARALPGLAAGTLAVTG